MKLEAKVELAYHWEYPACSSAFTILWIFCIVISIQSRIYLVERHSMYYNMYAWKLKKNDACVHQLMKRCHHQFGMQSSASTYRRQRRRHLHCEFLDLKTEYRSQSSSKCQKRSTAIAWTAVRCHLTSQVAVSFVVRNSWKRRADSLCTRPWQACSSGFGWWSNRR